MALRNKRERITKGTKRKSFCAFCGSLLCNKGATFSFLDKVFGGSGHPSSQRRGVRDIREMDPFRFVADGVVSSARLPRPAELTTPSAPLLWLRSIFLMAQPPLLCEEGNMTHSSSVQTRRLDIWLRLCRAKPFVYLPRFFWAKAHRGNSLYGQRPLER